MYAETISGFLFLVILYNNVTFFIRPFHPPTSTSFQFPDVYGLVSAYTAVSLEVVLYVFYRVSTSGAIDCILGVL